MTLADLFVAQLTDLFRVGLMIMLVITASRTSKNAGTVVPLILGVVFVAVIIPTTLSSDSPSKTIQIGVGLLSNAAILGVLLAVKSLATRLLAARR